MYWLHRRFQRLQFRTTPQVLFPLQQADLFSYTYCFSYRKTRDCCLDPLDIAFGLIVMIGYYFTYLYFFSPFHHLFPFADNFASPCCNGLDRSFFLCHDSFHSNVSCSSYQHRSDSIPSVWNLNGLKVRDSRGFRRCTHLQAYSEVFFLPPPSSPAHMTSDHRCFLSFQQTQAFSVYTH